MGARWYRPNTGTFTSRDTVFGALATPVSLNRYTYAWNDPLGMFDPDGRCAADVGNNRQKCVNHKKGVARGSSGPGDRSGGPRRSQVGGQLLCWSDGTVEYCAVVSNRLDPAQSLMDRWEADWDGTLSERVAFLMEVSGQAGGLTTEAFEIARDPETMEIWLGRRREWADMGSFSKRKEQMTHNTEWALLLGRSYLIGLGLPPQLEAPTIVESGALLPASEATPGIAGNTVSPWSLGPSPRGFAIEEALGGNLPRSFPTIDSFANGTATSIKSIDLTASSYQTAARLTGRLNGYVDSVAGFDGAVFDGVRIAPGATTARELVVAIEPGVASSAQQAALAEVVQYGASNGVTVRVVAVP